MYRAWTIATACLLTTGAACEPAGAGKEGIDKTSFAVEVARVIQPYREAQDFMGVVGVQKRGEPPFIRAYGSASLELDVPHSLDSVFMIGSVSKQITAAAILLLEQDGKLNTADKVGAHLPEFAHGHSITIHQLLTHTSGVADVYSLKSFGATRGQFDDFAAIIEEIGEQPLLPKPGTSFSYSNGGYSVLAAIIERVAEMPYDQFMQARIFVPLGMKDSGDNRPGPVRKHRVSGYDPWGEAGLTPAIPVSYAYLKGSGSLWSTAADILAWSQGLHGGQVLDEQRYQKFTKDYGSGYGYGISVFKRFGKDTIGHDGRVAGFSSDLAHYIEDETSVVILSNVQSVSRDLIRSHVAAAAFGLPVELPGPLQFGSPPEDLSSYAGAFSFGPGFTVYTEVFEGGRLMARANEGGWSELVPLENGMWFSRMLYATVRFERDEQGVVQRLLWGAGEGAPVGQRIDP